MVLQRDPIRSRPVPDDWRPAARHQRSESPEISGTPCCHLSTSRHWDRELLLRNACAWPQSEHANPEVRGFVDPFFGGINHFARDPQHVTDDDRDFVFPVVEHQTTCVEFIMNVLRRKRLPAANDTFTQRRSDVTGGRSCPKDLSAGSWFLSGYGQTDNKHQRRNKQTSNPNVDLSQAWTGFLLARDNAGG